VMLDLPVPEACHEEEMSRLAHRLETASRASVELEGAASVSSGSSLAAG